MTFKTTLTANPKQAAFGTLTPVNVTNNQVACTLNTRYNDMSNADIITLRHYPKTVILIEYAI